MALSRSSGRRRWAFRLVSIGGKRGAGCRHFHVHYHVPSQVWAFSPLLRWPARFSLLPYLLILPVLFFAVLAFLVCFGWFTLVYFVSFLWSKEDKHGLCVNRCANSASDGGESRGEDEEERDVEGVTELSGDYGSSLSGVCVEGQEIKFQLASRMASPGICIDDKEHANEEKIVKGVVMFETNKELKAFSELDDFLEKRQQVMHNPIDCFLEDRDVRGRDLSTSINTAKLVDVPYGEEFVANRKEMSVLCSLEILEFIDKHDTAEIAVDNVGSDFEIPDIPAFDDSSAHHGILNKHRKDVRQHQSIAEISLNSVVNHNRTHEGFLDEWQETQNLVTEHNKVPEDDSMEEEDGKKIVSTSDEPRDSLCQTVELAGSVFGNESQTSASSVCDQATGDQDCEIEEELIKTKRVETSTSASDVCDFADNHWRITEQLDGFASEESIHKEGLPENSAHETVSDEDDRNDNCTSTGSSRRLPPIKTSPSQWWNLCGVLDAFAGGEDLN